MKSRIADELGQRADLTTQITAAIQSAIKFYEHERFYFNETTGTFSTVVGQEYYSSSDYADIPNMILIDNVNLTISGSIHEIRRRSFNYIESVNTSTALQGDPTDYCYYKQQLRFYPIPQAVRTVTVAYVKRLAALSSDSDTNAWMTDGEQLIRARAKWDICLNLDHDPETAAIHRQTEMEMANRLRSATTMQISSGRLRPTQF
jgi:hypothetical protein